MNPPYNVFFLPYPKTNSIFDWHSYCRLQILSILDKSEILSGGKKFIMKEKTWKKYVPEPDITTTIKIRKPTPLLGFCIDKICKMKFKLFNSLPDDKKMQFFFNFMVGWLYGV